ncbi:MAG: alpha-2,8-polysialyltransferase family protein [Clostridiales bacterium]|nr:alpha-2,8-polysialyltransferase family protein [Clostridiales bacterium]
MSKIFICDNVYTTFVAIVMKMQMFSHEDVDIILNNRTPGSDDRTERLKKWNLFRNVYYFNTYDCYDDSRKIGPYCKKIKCMFMGCRKYTDQLALDYTDIYTLHAECLTSAIVRENGLVGKNINVHFIEEGYGSYTKAFSDMEFENLNGWRVLCESVAQKVSNVKLARNMVKDIYVFEPDMMMWNPPFPVKKIEKPDFDRYPALKKLINDVFCYDLAAKEYEGKKLIYFEDCIYQQAGDNSDMDIVNQLAGLVGKNNFLIKLHPRTRNNRFEGKYDTASIQGILWEVIAMNMPDDSKMTLVTIT